MALSPKAKLCFIHNCTELTPYDITGAYNASTNTTGWGSPNLTLAGVTSAILTVTLPSGDSEDFDLTTTVQGATIVDGQFLLTTLTPNSFGSSLEKFPDGIYELEYNIDSDTYIYSAKVFNTCQADCCVEKMKTKFAEKMCGCDWDVYWKNYQLAKAYLIGAKYKFACGNYTDATDILSKVNKICSINKCCC